MSTGEIKDTKGEKLLNTELTNAVKATDKEAQYDAGAKRLLGQKIILAHILVKTVEEFKGMNPDDIVSNIVGTPAIGIVPVEPGLTNTVEKQNGQRVVCFNTEDGEIAEGLVRFDIVFYVRMPSKGGMKEEISQIIINVEAQKDEPEGYDILNRAIFYVCRLISSQKERDFEKINYNDIKRVYSIWVCMNMEENTMSHIHLTKEDLIGRYDWKGNLDLPNIVMIGLAKKLAGQDKKYELHRLLGALLSMELTVDEKLSIIGKEYHISVEENLRKDVSVMCNLSQGIKEEGIAIGEARGRAIGEARGRAIGEARGRAIGEAGIIINMYHKGFSAEQIAEVTDKDPEDVRAIIAGKEPMMI